MTESPLPIPLILDLVKVAWPGFAWNACHSPKEKRAVWAGKHRGGDPEPPRELYIRPDSLDSFVRVLRAMPPEVLDRFNDAVEDWAIDRPNAEMIRIDIPGVLLIEPVNLWPLLHRAAFGEGKP